MNIDSILTKLKENIPECNLKTNVLMSAYTSFKIGGPVDIMVQPGSIDEVSWVLNVCRDEGIPKYVMGNGTNMLVRDKGIRGAVIKIGKNLSGVKRDGNMITAQAGIYLSNLSAVALDAGLSGLEFAAGIPGTLGGAVVMNAGAYNGEMGDVVKAAVCVDRDGNRKELKNGSLMMGYRESFMQSNKYIVIDVLLELTPCDSREIKKRIYELSLKRKTKQPLNMPSAGSTFKRPPGHYAGMLIEQVGLKGFSIGGAQISPKHAGFIVNKGGATAQDVIDLIEATKVKVKEETGILLETEIKIIGEE